MTISARLVAKAEAFRALHTDGVLVLPNVWDPLSARAIHRAGAQAIATTSGGVAWSRGVADGGGMDPETALDAVNRIVRAVDIPVSADLERGYDHASETVAAAIQLGISGMNIEDSVAGVLVDAADQAGLLAEIAATVTRSGVPIFVNARTDVFLFADPAADPEALLDQTVVRGAEYARAGADGLFVPGLADQGLIKRLVAAVALPVNIMVGAGPVDVAGLAGLGVRRISWGSQVAQSAYGWVQDRVRDLFATDGQSGLPAGLDFGPTNAEFSSAR